MDKNNPNARQVGGEHYRGKNPEYQHWDLMADNVGPGYFEAAITKYAERWKEKEGIQDVQKAIHYFEKLLWLYGSGKFHFNHARGKGKNLDHYFQTHNTDENERAIYIGVFSYRNGEELNALRPFLNNLLILARQQGTKDGILRCPHGLANIGNCPHCRSIAVKANREVDTQR